MAKHVIRPENLTFLPQRAYPYSPGTRAGGLVYTSGQVAWNADQQIVGIGDPGAQTRQVLENVTSILEAGGATRSDVMKCNVYLSDIRYFQAMNDVFAEFFPSDPPARTTVEARLATPDMLVEIEAIAWVGPADVENPRWLRPRSEHGRERPDRTEDRTTMKYLLLKHYRGAPAAVNDVPMDRWTPDEVTEHIQYMRDFAARLETPASTWTARRSRRRARSSATTARGARRSPTARSRRPRT